MAHVIAVDLGAESGRVMRVGFDGTRLDLQEVHRFPNIPVKVGATLHWDILRLWHEIKTGIEASSENALSIGVDTWGVDFALLDEKDGLLANPVHYRDDRTAGMMDWVLERVPRDTVFQRTGIQFMPINTLYQLASLAHQESPLFKMAARFLTIPDLLNYWLSGRQVCEFTNTTTTQCYNPTTGDWDKETLGALGVPTYIFPEVVQPGEKLGDYQGVPVIASACHDTGSAVVAVPATGANFAYLSSGTWSLLGLEVRQPLINAAALAANVTNEGGAFGTFRLLKNVMGLWLAQQSRQTWAEQGKSYTYNELVQMATEAQAFRSLIDPDDETFLRPGDMPAKIGAFCQKTGQPIPTTPGAVMRSIYESLALKYRYVLDKLTALTGLDVEYVHIVGGGAQNTLLNQMTANATGRVVLAGPVEATALGNAVVQLVALGKLADVSAARALLRQTVELHRFEPQDQTRWQESYQRFVGDVLDTTQPKA